MVSIQVQVLAESPENEYVQSILKRMLTDNREAIGTVEDAAAKGRENI